MEKLIEALRKETKALIAAIRQGAPLLDAYLYRTHIRCGKPTCRCMRSDYRHRLWCLSYVTDHRSHTRTIPTGTVPEVRVLCEQYRRLRAYRKRMLSLVEEVATAVDQHVEQHATEGWRRFAELKAPPRSRKTPGRETVRGQGRKP
jgi:hypothetical protein